MTTITGGSSNNWDSDTDDDDNIMNKFFEDDSDDDGFFNDSDSENDDGENNDTKTIDMPTPVISSNDFGPTIDFISKTNTAATSHTIRPTRTAQKSSSSSSWTISLNDTDIVDTSKRVAPTDNSISKFNTTSPTIRRNQSLGTAKKSSSSWTISLNDVLNDINHSDHIQATTNNNSSPIHVNHHDQNSDICYEWDAHSQTMKPLLVIPTKNVTIANNNDETNPINVLDDVLDTSRDKDYNTLPETIDKVMEERDIDDVELVEDDAEYEQDDMVNINNYYQSTRERFIPNKLENWWDRDDELVSKAKRRMKLQTIRKAQENPLHKRCKTCPVCKRVFKGHAAMLAHVMNKNNCSKDLSDEMKEQLKTQSIDMNTKKREKRKRKKYSKFSEEI
jgi:hypothetical protein